eukprot:7925346-Ditylum_brightwellii.AAC.1
MRYPSNEVGTNSGSCPLSFTLIIDVWAKATPVVCQNFLSQQHLVGLCCVDSISKRVLVIYLPQIEVDVTDEGDLGNKWIMRTISDTAGKMQPVKVSAKQIFHSFNKLACLYSNLPKIMKGSEIKKIPSADFVLPLPGDDPMHAVSLPLAILVSYAHRLQLGKVNNKDLRFDAEAYHPLMKKSDVPNNQGFESCKEGTLSVVTLLENSGKGKPFIINIEQCFDMVKNLNIVTWLKDYPNWVDPDVALVPRASKSPHAVACLHSSASAHDYSVATLSTSPDGRVTCHKIFCAVLNISGASLVLCRQL